MSKSKKLLKIQSFWPDCVKIKKVEDKYQCAVENSLGGLHWIWIDAAPSRAAKLIDPAWYEKERKRMKVDQDKKIKYAESGQKKRRLNVI